MTDNEGAKFWLQILIDLQNRGAKDFFIACVDGLGVLQKRLNRRIGNGVKEVTGDLRVGIHRASKLAEAQFWHLLNDPGKH